MAASYSTVDVLGLILGPAIVAAVVTAAVNVWTKRRDDSRTRVVAALLIASHLEDYAYACATYTFMSHEKDRAPEDKMSIPALNPWPVEVSWGSLPPVPASQAASIRMDVTIATGMAAATPYENELGVWQARRLRSELGLQAWRAARALRREAGLPLIRPETLRWNFTEYLWHEYGKAVHELRAMGMWNPQEQPFTFSELGYSAAGPS
ncbi:hypothetical protein LB557_17125 [Mesorhizobium sp. BR115XR7A]|uniref:hypothetical protein n=1 Tax=Mesorhizobium sp. BR115XR7A TaxID=2876645 RepID=UPI001CCA380D|nr:hypothetical protein [Mesorhizobium sp. BR115XR7A]MBZ9907732.1 hypothetical protein [Mesorhizobium sp. BR115XR7A]MBZ9929066.1 hypothetical protein [Mesorhizobium sp. BR1-1-5]